MKKSDFSYDYPESLVATQPAKEFRILFKKKASDPHEISKAQLFEMFQPEDLLVLNDTQVEKRRVFAGEVEILFIKALGEKRWEVLFPARGFSVGAVLPLPGGVTATLTQKGLPQVLQLSKTLETSYFSKYGEPALPPYIQKARGERHSLHQDAQWYQTAWAKHSGSVAAPTASLHFQTEDWEKLRRRGVRVEFLTLHVGLGTFLPIKVETLEEHQMHFEEVFLPSKTIEAIQATQKRGGKIWALGTTVTRSLEAWAQGHFQEDSLGFRGETNLFIRPGFQFKVVDYLMTNFHQPESTLLSLVGSFAGWEEVKRSYAFAIENKFRLFSYGDLSLWEKA